jgi:hypothetical protein
MGLDVKIVEEIFVWIGWRELRRKEFWPFGTEDSIYNQTST